MNDQSTRQLASSLRNAITRLTKKLRTRSATGEMLPFKDGAFRLAIDAGVPILPLVVSGTSTALRKHDWRVGKVNVVVRVLDPIETTGLTHKDIKQLRDRVRAVIEKERGTAPKAIPVPAQPEN